MIDMMCDDCSVRPANFHLKAVSEDGVREKNLCAVCMAKYQRRIPGLDFSNLAGILSGIFESKGSDNAEAPDEETSALVCDGCGTTYGEFRKNGRLGCSNCYAAFREPLEALLLRVHGNLQHAGRMPGGIQNDVSIKMNIDKLKQNLVKAIASEEYEQAAQIRDQIRSLTAQLEEAEANG
jgi:protein arginine kinase activator